MAEDGQWGQPARAEGSGGRCGRRCRRRRHSAYFPPASLLLAYGCLAVFFLDGECARPASETGFRESEVVAFDNSTSALDLIQQLGYALKSAEVSWGDVKSAGIKEEEVAAPYHRSRLLVGTAGLNTSQHLHKVLQENGAELGEKMLAARVCVLHITDGTDVAEKLEVIQQLDIFDYVELDVRVESNSKQEPPPSRALNFFESLSPVNPGDGLWAFQYGPRAIRADYAWGAAPGGQGEDVIVALLDTGVDLTHPDLANNLWVNWAELNGVPGEDDDGNGFVDDIHGYNFVDGNGSPSYKGSGHGTHVAGIIAAAAGGGGTVGVAPRVKIMPIEFLDSQGNGYLSESLRAINYGVANGAQIFCHSWGSLVPQGSPPGQSMRQVIADTAPLGILHVASAGNDGLSLDAAEVHSIPCTFSMENLVCVASSDSADQLSGFSNWGPVHVDVAAPGDDILSTLPGGLHGSMSGTSMAAPHVVGVAAIILSTAIRNGNLSASEPAITASFLRQVLLQSADRIPGLEGRVASGRVNALSGVQAVITGYGGPYVPVPAIGSLPSWAAGYGVLLLVALTALAVIALAVLVSICCALLSMIDT